MEIHEVFASTRNVPDKARNVPGKCLEGVATLVTVEVIRRGVWTWLATLIFVREEREKKRGKNVINLLQARYSNRVCMHIRVCEWVVHVVRLWVCMFVRIENTCAQLFMCLAWETALWSLTDATNSWDDGSWTVLCSFCDRLRLGINNAWLQA